MTEEDEIEERTDEGAGEGRRGEEVEEVGSEAESRPEAEKERWEKKRRRE